MITMHFGYVRYLVRHKWFVLLSCIRLGIVWRGLIHDWTKFLPLEWLAYADHFHGRKLGVQRDPTGYYKPTDTGDPAFDLAWLHHAHSNRHHWQWWCQPDDSGGIRVHDMSETYVREMVADWRGAARAQGTPSVIGWYEANKGKMLLSPATRRRVEELLAS
jgi:hypothetical protein